ncbi:unnamed protein product [Durusdinium trenchii]|uniref:Histone deacetylase complex subunit SAP30 Sin3 binding domain-containing protein n=1 Tax=Durusdinium trenchii TaxID=1381693 RepID=A0ABP0KMK3_9DINO
MEHQTGDDQSFTDLLEACTDGFLKRQKTALSSGGMTTHGREPRERNSSSSVSKPVRMPAIGTVSNALCPPCSGDCSRSGLQCDDNRPCQRFVREYRIPLPNLHTLQQATLAKLISTHFD